MSSRSDAALSILAYSLASNGMIISNKLILSSFKFPMNLLLLAIQNTTVVLVLLWLRSREVVNFKRLSFDELKAWTPVAALLCSMIYTGSKALQYLHISVVTVVKNLTIVFIAYGEHFMGIGSHVSPLMLTAFSLMVVGSLSAAWNDIQEGGGMKDSSDDSWKIAYFWMFLNCVTSATYSVYLRFAMKKVQFKDFDTVFASNLLSTPMLLTGSLLVENHYWRNLSSTIETSWGMFAAIAFSAALSFAISYASSWCVRVTSSTTFSMVGALNKLPTSMAGFLFFQEPLTIGRLASVILAFFAGLVYTKAKQEQAKPANRF